MPTAPVARTPLQTWHANKGARFAEQDGWQVVRTYSTAEKEADAARAGLGVADVSASAKVSLREPGVAAYARALVPHSPPGPRSVAAIPAVNAIACRLSDRHLLLLGTAASSVDLTRHLASLFQTEPVVQTDVSSAYAGFLLLGPQLEETLSRLTHLDVRLASFPVNTCAETTLAGIEALLVRCAEVTLPSMRIYVAWDMAEYVWERIFAAGGAMKTVTPLGLDAVAAST